MGIALAGSLTRLAERVATVTVRGWRDAVYLQERLLDAERPGETEGTLRWQRQLGSHRLVGSYLPGTGDGFPAGDGVP